MESFLAGCKAALQEHVQTNQKVHVVLGNEACDLDSMVSALALAYFFAKTSQEPTAAFIPVLNIPRLDFPLRTESTFLLKEQRIPESSLVFRDEIDLATLHQTGLLSLTLVDHHVLSSRDSDLEKAVAEVIDHRPLELQRDPPCKVTTELVGSCATLVTEMILQHPARVLDKQTAALLHGTIVLDCVNMAPEAGKVTPKDSRYVSLLESEFPDLPSRSTIFEALQKAKFDVSDLTTDQMLRKDLKDLSGKEATIAISAIYVNLQVFLLRPGLDQELHAFCQQKGYDVLLAMTISFNARHEPFRQLAVYSPHTELRAAEYESTRMGLLALRVFLDFNSQKPKTVNRHEWVYCSVNPLVWIRSDLCFWDLKSKNTRSAKVCQTLERSTDPSLDLSPLESPYSTLRAYDQGNTTASRKKVLPVVKAFLREWDQRRPAGTAMQPEATALCRKTRSEAKGAESHGPELSRKDPAKAHYLGEDLADDDAPLPPTPMNSLVDDCPLDQGLPKLSAEAVFERFNRIAVVRSSTDGSPGKK